MKKSHKQVSSNNVFYKFLGIVVIAVVVWSLFSKNGANLTSSNSAPKMTEKSAQLTSPKSAKDWGTVAKSTDGINYELNVTAFLPKVTGSNGYYVFLKGDGNTLKDTLIGKMEMSGDVYSLNYQSGLDIFGYKEVVVVKATEAQAKANNMSAVVLSGMFAQ